MTEPASKRQLWALFCATKEDYRDKRLTKAEASEMLSKLNNGRTRWTKDKVLSVIKEARRAGKIAAQAKLAELQKAGPQWAVVNDTNFGGDGKCVGTMLDVCGSACFRILARGKFYLLAKKLSEDNANRIYCTRGYYGGGTLSIFDCTMRQELTVNTAAYKAMAEILKKYGIEATVQTYID